MWLSKSSGAELSHFVLVLIWFSADGSRISVVFKSRLPVVLSLSSSGSGGFLSIEVCCMVWKVLKSCPGCATCPSDVLSVPILSGCQAPFQLLQVRLKAQLCLSDFSGYWVGPLCLPVMCLPPRATPGTWHHSVHAHRALGLVCGGVYWSLHCRQGICFKIS